ncbi:N-acetylglucosamine kinase-like BadF-type ATPase [Kibdelosporangium banguiense]|uniref:N-acetylglucosamine kinase-like BadF-type ATPase n=1 Tax=Kibdelosporangium banguiense TaxID=1365924 RepID=A0ABS4TV20_9PSEU|nr:BadF/BadG/BcrA/BcrD ATPase family protein [Kibdelosporangium banguiense]MBP2328244.1 N-acetylglucosamine kinase-like BadF-type ATPase [Kibdelosporangium banguiense]
MFLGVDGGGTKTAFCLVDLDGRIAAEARTASVYYLSDGLPIVEPLLRQGIDEVCRTAGISVPDITYAFFGLPAYGEISTDQPMLDALLARILGTADYRCGNDMICGWAGSLGAVDGINVVAGTGSIAYGEHEGRQWRGGGWSELFGDEGSGYWVAIHGLNAFSRMVDGRLPAGPLVGEMRQALSLAADFDAIDVVVNRWHGDRGKIANLSKVVVQAAGAGDTVATGILREAGRELALLVDVGRRALEFDASQPVAVSYSGGMFGSAHVLASFRDSLSLKYDLREPLLRPHIGAALYAARLHGHPLRAEQVHSTASFSLAEEPR